MLLVDSGVWIDYSKGNPTPQADRLDALLGSSHLATCDLVMAEVLQGAASEREFNQLLRLFLAMPSFEIVDQAIAVQAARNYRSLRARGVTVRKTVDTLIATRCIVDGHSLLYSDRDFDPFVEHLGLETAMA